MMNYKGLELEPGQSVVDGERQVEEGEEGEDREGGQGEEGQGQRWEDWEGGWIERFDSCRQWRGGRDDLEEWLASVNIFIVIIFFNIDVISIIVVLNYNSAWK